MNIRLWLILASLVGFLIFTLFSYTVLRQHWQRVDFDTTVKVQDKIPSKFVDEFSFLSLLGSVEVTVLFALIAAGFSLVRKRFWAVLGWLLIFPASFAEVLGKIFIFHPGPPVLFHKSVIETHLPSFYIDTNFSYPSGHITRTAFIATVLIVAWLFGRMNIFNKLTLIGGAVLFMFLMVVSRIYLGDHWLSDVIGGGILGLSSGLLAASLIFNKKTV